MTSDSWTWGELLAVCEVANERQQAQLQTIAMMLYRFGMYFVPGDKTNGPEMWELFPLWTDQQVADMELAQLKARMQSMAAKPVRKDGKR